VRLVLRLELFGKGAASGGVGSFAEGVAGAAESDSRFIIDMGLFARGGGGALGAAVFDGGLCCGAGLPAKLSGRVGSYGLVGGDRGSCGAGWAWFEAIGEDCVGARDPAAERDDLRSGPSPFVYAGVCSGGSCSVVVRAWRNTFSGSSWEVPRHLMNALDLPERGIWVDMVYY
jgi:hypothetical protein